MRITFPTAAERIGAVRFHEPGRIIELDSSGDTQPSNTGGNQTFISNELLDSVHREMTVVVPIKDERRSTLRGVLAGIPGPCNVVVISASRSEPIDRFALEREVIDEFESRTGRTVLHVHQRHAGLASAVAAAGMTDLIDGDGLIWAGKGEAMVVGTMIADAAQSAAVGFVDADNYVPGAVNEYVRIFSATIAASSGEYTMGRISWQSKPKVEDGELVFNRWGRTSAISNRILNEVLSHYLGEGTRIITTGNAGEQVISLPLARILRFTGGFGAETGQFVDLLEQFGGIIRPVGPVPDCVSIVQTETINPHFHEDKGSEHLEAMRDISLATITVSPICPPAVIKAYPSDIEAPRRYPALGERGTIDIDRIIAAFADVGR